MGLVTERNYLLALSQQPEYAALRFDLLEGNLPKLAPGNTSDDKG